MIVSYVILQDDKAVDLSKKVEVLLNKDWELVGSPFPTGGRNVLINQALLKREIEEHERVSAIGVIELKPPAEPEPEPEPTRTEMIQRSSIMHLQQEVRDRDAEICRLESEPEPGPDEDEIIGDMGDRLRAEDEPEPEPVLEKERENNELATFDTSLVAPDLRGEDSPEPASGITIAELAVLPGASHGPSLEN